MACEHLVGATYPLCTVVRGLMAPSLWEMRVYCEGDRPYVCPLYQLYAATRERVPLEAAVQLIGTSAAEPAGPTPLCEQTFASSAAERKG